MPTLAELRRQSILEDRQRKKNSWTYDYTPQQQPQEETGVLENLWNGAIDMGKSALRGFLTPAAMTARGLDAVAKGIGEKTGLESGGLFGNVADTLEDWSTSLGNGEQGNQFSGQGITERVFNPDWWASKYGAQSEIPEALGNALFFLLPAGRFSTFTAPSRALSALSGKASTAGMGNLAKALGSKTAQDFANSGATFAATMAPFGAFVNASSIVDPLREQGKSYSDIVNQMARMSLEELPADIAFSALTGGVMKGAAGRAITNSLPNRISNQTARNVFGNLGAAGLEGLGSKFSNEYQMRLANMYSGKPYGTWDNPTPEEVDAGVMGILGGAIPSAVGIFNNNQTQNENPPPQPRSDSVQDIFTDAQIQAKVDRYEGDNYTGENGKAEGKYWERNHNMDVSFEGAQPDLMNAIDKLAKYYYENTGKRLVINAGTNGTHADGEHSHAAGWKVDVVDAGGSDVSMSEDGPLFTAGFEKGPFLDEFIAYGRSLGLGMNLENLGTSNVHLDIALDGTQWDGNGEDAGGFNSANRGQVSETPRPQSRGGASIDQFMSAISGQESNDNYDAVNSDSAAAGKFQIMPENWASWAQDAGLSPDAPMTPENQDLVAKNKMLEYYKKFGNWRDVAIAWYGGEGAVSYSEEAKSRPQYFGGNEYPSINEYADSVMARLEKIAGTTEGEVISESPSTSRAPSISLPTESTETAEYQDEAEEEFKPIKFSDDDETQSLFEKFTYNQARQAEGKDANKFNFFKSFFENDDAEFQNTQENRDKVIENYGDELRDFLARQGYFEESLGKPEQKAKSQLQQPQEQSKPQQGKVEFEGIKPPPKQYLGSEFEKLGTVEKIRAIRDWASESGNVKLMSDASTIENSGDKQAQEKFVRDNPLPKEFIQRWEEENAEEPEISEETSTLETPAQEKPKPKVEIPAKTLNIARAEVDMDNSNARKRQAEALLEIAKLNKFTVDKDLARLSKKGFKQSVPQLKALLEEQGFLNDNTEGKESTADRHKKIRSEYQAKQKELDEAYRAVQEIPTDTIDVKARRTALKNFNSLLSERDSTREKFWESTRQVNEEWRQSRKAPKSDYRKVEADYQNEIDEIADQMKTVREQGLKLEGAEMESKAKEFKALEKQKKSLSAELHKFQKSAAHLEDLRGKLADIEGFIEEGEKNSKLTKQRDALQKQISALERELGINQTETTPEKIETPPQETVQPTQIKQETPAPSTVEESVPKVQSNIGTVRNELSDLTKQLDTEMGKIRQAKTPAELDSIEKTLQGLMAQIETKENEVAELEKAHGITPKSAEISQPAQTTPQQNQSFGETQQQTNQILENIKAQESKSQKSETPPTSKKTYHFDGTKAIDYDETADQFAETPTVKKTLNADALKSRPAGKSEKILTDNQKSVETHYKVVSADELIPSHEWNGDAVFENKNYPADEKLQPRESRKGNAMTLNAIKRANNLHPELLTDSKNVNQGAPLVRGDGVVLNGNGRILSINRAYKNGKADGYKKHLIDNAEKFGLDAEEISKIENPVLIREVNQELTPELTSEIINSKTGGESFNDTELAREDAKKISFKPTKKYIEGGNLNDLLYDVANEIVPESERNKYFRDGGLTTSGVNRAKNALFAKAYGEKGLLDDISNSGEEFSQNLQDALLESAPHTIQANKNRPNYHIGEVISDAAEKYVGLRKKRKNVASYVKEERATDSMFGPQRAAELDIIETIDNKVRNKNELRSFFRDIAKNITNEKDKKSGMFQSEEADKRVDEIVADAKKKFEESQGQNLFEVEGNPDVAITDDMIVADKDLTSQQKTFTEIGNKMGLLIKFFRGDPSFRGVLRKGISYINVNNKNFEQTFYHEAAHYLSYFNPELFDQIFKAVPITKEQLQAIREKSPLYENLNERQLKEEILADNFMDLSKRAGFLREVGKQNKTLAEKIVSWLKSLMDKFTSYFSNPKGGLTRTQREAMYKSFKRNIDSIVDKNGNKIFRMSNKTFEIQRANGEKLPKVDLKEKLKQTLRGVFEFNQRPKITFEREYALAFSVVGKIAHQEGSGSTQVAGTRTMYVKALKHLRGLKDDIENVLDYGAGLGLGTEDMRTANPDLQIDSFEPDPRRWQGKEKPTFTDNTKIKNHYDAILNTNVLNVVEPEIRDSIVRDIGTLLKEDGVALITTRGWKGDIENTKNYLSGEEPHSVWITKKIGGKHVQVYQKGFDGNELLDYVSDLLGNEFSVKKISGFGKNAVLVTRLTSTQDRYSIDPSDNSNESWKRKIRQAASWVWNGTEYDTRIRHRIIQKIDKATGFKTRFLKRRSKDPAMVDEFHKIIRLETAYDFENLLPMTGKYIAEKLNLQPSEKMNNYIAEWIWDGAPTNSSEESRLFEKAMRENPEMAETLVSLQEDFQTWNNMTALERAKAIIVQGGKKKQWRGLKNLKKVFTTAVTDDLDALEKMKQEIEERTGEKIEINLDPHKNAALVRGSGGIAESLISAETPKEADYALAELKQKYKNVNFDGVKPVQQIISEIGGAEKVDDFLSFWLAKYYKELHEKNGKIKASAEEHRQKLRDKIDNLEEKISQLENKREKNKIQKELDKTRKELDDYEPKLFKTGLSESDRDNIIEQFQEEFGQAEQDIVRFCNAILDIQADSGLVTKKTAERWKSENKHYAPMTYVFDEADKLTWSDSTMHREGSTRDAVSMLETLLRNTSRCIRAAEVNKFKLNLAHLARAGTIGEILSEEEVKNSAEPFISFKENGKVKHLATTPDIKAAVDSLTGSQTQSNFVLAGIKAVANIFRATVTSANPMFAAGNPIRDAQEAYLYNRNGSLNPYHMLKNIAEAYWNVIHAGLRGLGAGRLHPYFNRDLLKENPNYKKFLVSGGSQATMLSNDIDQIDDYLKNITRTNLQKFFGVKGEGGWTRAKGFFKQLVRTLQEVSEITETTTRLKVFEHNLERYGAKRENGIATYEDERQAALDARNATTDFAKGGTASKFFNQYIPFFNPTIQGLAKDANLLKDCAKVHTKEGRTLLKNTIARIIFGTVSMALAQSLYRLAFGKDDDDDEYGTNDWKKNTNWIFGSLSIPKSYSFLQRFFGVAFEDLFAKIFDGRNVKNDRYRKIISEALPSIMPVVIGTGLEAWTNYSFFYGGPIVPQKEEGISAYKQYGHKTSELAKWLGGSSLATFLSEVFLGKSGGISPRRIDYVMKDFGFLDTVINGAINKFVKSFRGEDTSLSETELPILNRFVFNPIQNPQIVIDYYNAKSEQEQLERDYKDNKKRGIKELPEGYDPQLYRRIKSVEKAMKRISEQEEKIRDNLKLPKEEAQRQIDELNRRRIQLCKKVFGYN